MTYASTDATSNAWAVLQLLLCGDPAAADHLTNNLRVEARGCTTFGRTDAIDLFAAHPLTLSSTAQVLMSPQAMAVLDETIDGRTIGAFADLVDGVIARLWLMAASATDASAEPGVAVARDDFMSQLRQHCQGDAADHLHLQASAWHQVLELGNTALGSLHSPPQPPAASSSQAWVMRAFSNGTSVVALYRLRVQTAPLPRQAHERLALALTHGLGLEHRQGPDLRTNEAEPANQQPREARQTNPGHQRPSAVAVSDALPNPAPISF